MRKFILFLLAALLALPGAQALKPDQVRVLCEAEAPWYGSDTPETLVPGQTLLGGHIGVLIEPSALARRTTVALSGSFAQAQAFWYAGVGEGAPYGKAVCIPICVRDGQGNDITAGCLVNGQTPRADGAVHYIDFSLSAADSRAVYTVSWPKDVEDDYQTYEILVLWDNTDNNAPAAPADGIDLRVLGKTGAQADNFDAVFAQGELTMIVYALTAKDQREIFAAAEESDAFALRFAALDEAGEPLPENTSVELISHDYAVWGAYLAGTNTAEAPDGTVRFVLDAAGTFTLQWPGAARAAQGYAAPEACTLRFTAGAKQYTLTLAPQIIYDAKRESGAQLLADAMTLAAGETGVIAFAYDDPTAQRTAFSIPWTSIDPTVAAVDENGLVTALAPGQTHILGQDALGNPLVVVVQVVSR